MSFATRLKKLRNARQVTQQELADYLNVTRPTIAGYETKGKEPDYKTISMIASYFNVSIDYLLSGREFPDSLNHSPSTTEFERVYDDYTLLNPEAKSAVPILIERLQKMEETDVNRLLEYSSLLLYHPQYHKHNEK